MVMKADFGCIIRYYGVQQVFSISSEKNDAFFWKNSSSVY